jgi:hypothetical protein
MPADLLINPGHRQDIIVPNDRNDDDLAPFDFDLELLANPQAYHMRTPFVIKLVD